MHHAIIPPSRQGEDSGKKVRVAGLVSYQVAQILKLLIKANSEQLRNIRAKVDNLLQKQEQGNNKPPLTTKV